MAVLGKLQRTLFGTPNGIPNTGADDFQTTVEKLEANSQLMDGRYVKLLIWTHDTAYGITGSGDVTTAGYAFKTLDNQDFYLPKNAQITDGRYKVLVTLTSATDAATPGLTIPTDDADGIKAKIAISNGANAWDSTLKWVGIIQTGAVANDSEATTDVRQILLSNAVENITAGAVLLQLEIVIDPLHT